MLNVILTVLEAVRSFKKYYMVFWKDISCDKITVIDSQHVVAMMIMVTKPEFLDLAKDEMLTAFISIGDSIVTISSLGWLLQDHACVKPVTLACKRKGPIWLIFHFFHLSFFHL